MRRPTALAWALLLAAALFAFLLWRRDRRWEESSRAEVAALEGKRQTLEAARRALLNAPRRPTPGPAKDANPKGAATAGRPKAAYQVLQNDAKLQAAYLSAKRAGIASAYSPLFRKLQLSPDKSAALEALIIQREEAAFDTAAAVPRVFRAMTTFDSSQFARLVIDPYNAISYSAGRMPPNSMPTNASTEAAVALLQQNADQFQTAVTSLLGADGYGQLQQFERVLPVQPQANELANALTSSPQPLTVAQSDGLLQLLAQNSAAYQQGDDATFHTIDWDRVAQQLPSVLSPAQTESVQYTIAYWQANARYDNAISHISPPH